MIKYSDDNFLHMFFSYYLSHTYGDDVLRNAFANGFDEPVDTDYIAPFFYDLAERLGYRLENNMWVDIKDTEASQGKEEIAADKPTDLFRRKGYVKPRMIEVQGTSRCLKVFVRTIKSSNGRK